VRDSARTRERERERKRARETLRERARETLRQRERAREKEKDGECVERNERMRIEICDLSLFWQLPEKEN